MRDSGLRLIHVDMFHGFSRMFLLVFVSLYSERGVKL